MASPLQLGAGLRGILLDVLEEYPTLHDEIKHFVSSIKLSGEATSPFQREELAIWQAAVSEGFGSYDPSFKPELNGDLVEDEPPALSLLLVPDRLHGAFSVQVFRAVSGHIRTQRAIRLAQSRQFYKDVQESCCRTSRTVGAGWFFWVAKYVFFDTDPKTQELYQLKKLRAPDTACLYTYARLGAGHGASSIPAFSKRDASFHKSLDSAAGRIAQCLDCRHPGFDVLGAKLVALSEGRIQEGLSKPVRERMSQLIAFLGLVCRFAHQRNAQGAYESQKLSATLYGALVLIAPSIPTKPAMDVLLPIQTIERAASWLREFIFHISEANAQSIDEFEFPTLAH
jgi:hypothetical protein